MPAAGVVTIALIVLIVLALVYYLLSTILQLRKINHGLDEVIQSVGEIVEKSAPVADVVARHQRQPRRGRRARSRACSSRRPGWSDALGLVDGLYPGAAAEGLRDFPESREVTPPRIAEVYTRGTLTLARLGREAPIAMANPAGPRPAQPGVRQRRRARCCTRRAARRGRRAARSPVIGTDAPVQYEQREDIGKPRKRFRRA